GRLTVVVESHRVAAGDGEAVAVVAESGEHVPPGRHVWCRLALRPAGELLVRRLLPLLVGHRAGDRLRPEQEEQARPDERDEQDRQTPGDGRHRLPLGLEYPTEGADDEEE